MCNKQYKWRNVNKNQHFVLKTFVSTTYRPGNSQTMHLLCYFSSYSVFIALLFPFSRCSECWYQREGDSVQPGVFDQSGRVSGAAGRTSQPRYCRYIHFPLLTFVLSVSSRRSFSYLTNEAATQNVLVANDVQFQINEDVDVYFLQLSPAQRPGR